MKRLLSVLMVSVVIVSSGCAKKALPDNSSAATNHEYSSNDTYTSGEDSGYSSLSSSSSSYHNSSKGNILSSALGETSSGLRPPSQKEPESVTNTGIVMPSVEQTQKYSPYSLGDASAGDCSMGAELNAKYGQIGSSLESTCFVMQGRNAYASQQVTYKQLVMMLKAGTLQNRVYYVTDKGSAQLTGAQANLNGNNAVIIAAGTLEISGFKTLALKNITWINTEGGSPITFEGCSSVSLDAVEVVSKRAVIFDKVTKTVDIKGCRIISGDKGVILPSSIETANIYNSAIAADAEAIFCQGNNIVIQNCYVNSPTGIYINSSDTQIKYCTIRGSVRAEDCQNLLLSQSCLYGVIKSLSLQKVKNGVAVLNRMVGVECKNSSSVYIVDNSLSHNLSGVQSKYLLADGNAFSADAGVSLSGVEYPSGDSVTNVKHRPSVGANEDLLPKQDKDLFIGMARKTSVRAIESTGENVGKYILNQSKNQKVVIVPPGAYTQVDAVAFSSNPDVTVYGYGALIEKTSYKTKTLYSKETKNLTVKGFALGHDKNSTGNVVVVSKSGDGMVEVIAGAGMLPDWTDKAYYSLDGLSQVIYGYRSGSKYTYSALNASSMTYDEKTGIISIKFNQTSYDKIKVGDRLSCRGSGANAVEITESDSFSLTDVSVYGAGSFCINDVQSVGGGVKLLRVWDTTAPAPIISKSEYERYKALENKYGVSFDVYVDKNGNYRGTQTITSSVDATHSSGSEVGMTVTSCLFESMCDDGTNQTSPYARVIDIVKKSDKLVEVTYKSNFTPVVISNGWNGSVCVPFKKGDRVFAYRSDGLNVLNGIAQSATQSVSSRTNEYNKTEYIYKVLVAAENFDSSALDGVDRQTADPNVLKICLENHSRASQGYYFDNCLIQNTCSRGLILKASDGTVTHCSIKNVGNAAINICQETDWSEAGVAQKVRVLYNYIENSGYGNRGELMRSSIVVYGTGTEITDEKYVTQRNYEIIGNKIVNRQTAHAVYLHGVDGAVIEKNDFGYRKLVDGQKQAAPLYFESVRNIKVNKNTYPPELAGAEQRVLASIYKNVAGGDISGYPQDVTLGKKTDFFAQSLPIYDSQGNVTYQGNWQVGTVSRTTGLNFQPYTTYLADVGWLCNGEKNLWGGTRTGGFWLGKGCRYNAMEKYNCVIQFTADADGVYKITLSEYNDPIGDGMSQGYYAIAKNSEIIWPLKSSDYNNSDNYFNVTLETELVDFLSAGSNMTVSLKKGDTLRFTARRKDKWSNFSIMPSVTRIS